MKKNTSQKIPKTKNISAVCETLHDQNKNRIKSDVSGSYTGNPADGIFPVQDADDL